MIYFPKDSIKVLLPTPGIPVIAIRFEVFEVGNKLIILKKFSKRWQNQV